MGRNLQTTQLLKPLFDVSTIHDQPRALFCRMLTHARSFRKYFCSRIGKASSKVYLITFYRPTPKMSLSQAIKNIKSILLVKIKR